MVAFDDEQGAKSADTKANQVAVNQHVDGKNNNTKRQMDDEIIS